MEWVRQVSSVVDGYSMQQMEVTGAGDGGCIMFGIKSDETKGFIVRVNLIRLQAHPVQIVY